MGFQYVLLMALSSLPRADFLYRALHCLFLSLASSLVNFFDLPIGLLCRVGQNQIYRLFSFFQRGSGFGLKDGTSTRQPCLSVFFLNPPNKLVRT